MSFNISSTANKFPLQVLTLGRVVHHPGASWKACRGSGTRERHLSVGCAKNEQLSDCPEGILHPVQKRNKIPVRPQVKRCSLVAYSYIYISIYLSKLYYNFIFIDFCIKVLDFFKFLKTLLICRFAAQKIFLFKTVLLLNFLKILTLSIESLKENVITLIS